MERENSIFCEKFLNQVFSRCTGIDFSQVVKLFLFQNIMVKKKVLQLCREIFFHHDENIINFISCSRGSHFMKFVTFFSKNFFQFIEFQS